MFATSDKTTKRRHSGPPALVVHPSPAYAYLVFGGAGIVALTTVFAWTYWRAHDLVLVVGLLAAAAIALCALERYVTLQFTSLIIGADKLQLVSGFVSKRRISLNCEKIESVKVEQTAGEMLLGLATIRVDTGSNTGLIEIENVSNPESVADQIMQLTNRREKRDPLDD